MGRRRTPPLTAAALSAVFAATGCNSTSAVQESPPSTTIDERTRTTEGTTTSSSTTTSSTAPRPTSGCVDQPGGMTMCWTDGRPLWRKHRRRRGLLLPIDDGDLQARTEYASVASFGELALRLLAVGAPVELVEACHRAALDEVRHARAADILAGREGDSGFGAIPGLLGRRIGGRRRSRRAELRRIAVESFLDGWMNEGAAAARLRRRAIDATALEHDTLLAMADDEQGHAELARAIVTWCFGEDPAGVGRALAAVA